MNELIIGSKLQKRKYEITKVLGFLFGLKDTM